MSEKAQLPLNQPDQIQQPQPEVEVEAVVLEQPPKVETGSSTQLPAYPSEKVVTEQPQNVSDMQVGNKNVKNLPVDEKGRDWSHGLCDCFGDRDTCVLACCCPCIVYGRNEIRLDHLNTENVPHPLRKADGFGMGVDCAIHFFVNRWCGLGRILQISSRQSARERYHIKGGGCGDCCTSFCCSACDLTQVSREIELEENSFGHDQVVT